MKSLQNLSIKARSLIFLSSSIALLFALLGGLFYFLYADSLEKNLEQKLVGTAQALSLVLTADEISSAQTSSVEDPAWRAKQNLLNTFKDRFGTTYVYAMRRQPSGEVVFTHFDDPKKEYGDSLLIKVYDDYPEELKQVLDGQGGRFTQPYTDQYGSFKSWFMPVTGADGKVAGALGVDFDITAVRAAEGQSQLILLVAFVALVAGLTGFLLYMNGLVFKPLKEVARRSLDLAEGQGDLSRDVEVHSVGEIKALTDNFNKFIHKLNAMVNHLKQAASMSQQVSQELAASSEEASSASVQIASNVESMEHRAVLLNQQVSEAETAVGDITGTVGALVTRLEDFSRASDRTFELLKQMLAAIESTQALAQKNLEFSEKLGQLASQGESDMKKTMEGLTAIGASAGAIYEMIKVVNDVSERTNLLAMNASIEAAHAGSFGRGFSVVAQEIRKLAEATGRNALEINASLNQITEKMTNTDSLARRSTISFQEMVQGIFTVKNSTEAMSREMLTAREASSALGRAMDELHSVGEEVKTSSGTIHQRTGQINSSINRVAELSEESRVSMKEMAVGLDEIKHVITLVAEMSNQNSMTVSILEEELAKFKTIDAQT